MKIKILLVVFFVLTTAPIQAEFGINLTIENGTVIESLNKARIPGDSGTLIDLNQNRKSPALIFGPRIYAAYKLNSKNELRALWAPLQLNGTYRSDQPINFQGETFAPNQDINTFYKFNSYRLSYIYHFDEFYSWNFGLGFTAKIRDAEIKLSRNDQVARKPNIGFVPLIHIEGTRHITENWSLKIDFDGLAAPQGRAFDLALLLQRYITLFGAGHVLYMYAGYRTVEGGADNETVYNFAWFQSAVLGLKADF